MARLPVEAEVRLTRCRQSEFDDFHHRQNKQRKHVLDSIEFPLTGSVTAFSGPGTLGRSKGGRVRTIYGDWIWNQPEAAPV